MFQFLINMMDCPLMLLVIIDKVEFQFGWYILGHTLLLEMYCSDLSIYELGHALAMSGPRLALYG